VSRVEAWTLHLATLLVGGTGLVYAWMRYFLESADPFAAVNHPWQPHAQHLHVLSAPLLVFASGLVWRCHVLACRRLGIRERHRTGATLALSLLPMVASGYLLQTATGEEWRRIWLWIHVAAAALWLLGYLVHQLLPRRGASPFKASSAPTSGAGG
jgi:hypothetical protein